MVAVLGTMRELGDTARDHHQPPRIATAADPDALLPLLKGLLAPGDIVLIKASRSVGLEQFASLLQTEVAGWQPVSDLVGSPLTALRLTLGQS
jgi:UDP-N-acetylmuramyl pentapeptide synthase